MASLIEITAYNAVSATLLATVAWIVGRSARRPQLAHLLWLLVLLKLITPPLFQVAVPVPAVHHSILQILDFNLERPGNVVPPATNTVSGAVAASPSGGSSRHPSWPAYPALFWIWLAGSCVVLAVSLRRAFLFQRLLALATPAPPQIEETTRHLCDCMGLQSVPRVVTLPARIPPLVWAFLVPARIVLPNGLLTRLRPQEMKTLLCHELAHLKRGDHWIRVLELIPTVLFWWHPVLWLAKRQMREAEELCCDAEVVGLLPNRTRGYAHALLEALDFLADTRSAPAPAVSFNPMRSFQRRLQMILQRRTPLNTSLSGWLLIVLLATSLPLAAFPLSAVTGSGPDPGKQAGSVRF